MKWSTCLLAALMTVTMARADQAFFVAPSGNDAWSGTQPDANADANDGPWRTIEHARDALRLLRAAGTINERVVINLRAGEYRPANDKPIELTAADSGRPGAPVVWRSMPGERATITGGRRVTNWQIKEGVWTAHLPDLVDAESGAFGALWINGQRRTVARSPNGGAFFKAHGRADPKARHSDITHSRTAANRGFRFDADNIANGADSSDAIVTVFHAWEVSYHRIASVDETNRTVEFVNDAYWPFGQWNKDDQRYYVENTRAALDQPGEWYLDRKSKTLHYLPMPGETPEKVEAIVPVARQLLVVQGDPAKGAFAEHIRFEDITFAYTDWPIGAKGHSDAQAAYSVRGVVEWKFARLCEMIGCTVEHTGGYGAWLDAGSQQNRIAGNHFHDLGAGGIRVGGSSDPVGQMKQTDVVASRNVIDNNWIHDGGKICHAGVGVWIGHANYTTVSHNEISDFFYTGISNGWVWGYGENPAHHNIIEYNHIHHLGKKLLSDMGGVYNLGVQPGTVIRNNHIHDIQSFDYGGWGLYTDEGSAEMLIENNVVYNTTSAGFHQHYGRNNWIRNNIFAFSDGEQVAVTRIEPHRSFVFERNIVLARNGKMISHQWRKVNSWCDYNLYWNVTGEKQNFGDVSFAEWTGIGQDAHSTVADPKFKDVAKYDFTLAADSPARAMGFEPIDLSRVGLYGDPAWVAGPERVRRD